MIKGLEEALRESDDLADKIYWILVYEGQSNPKFRLGELIRNTPSEVRKLVKKYAEYLA